jgi:dienelactone hydrolase
MKNVTQFLLAVGLACGLTATLRAQPALAELKIQAVDYKQGDTALEGYLAFDNSVSGKRPGVLLLHRYDGMSDFTRQHADAVAKLGYVVFAPDIYGKDVRPKNVQEFIAQSSIYNKDRPLMRARAQAGFDVLRQSPMVDPGRIAMVGYCFGGTVAVEFAEIGAPVIGAIAIHGSFRDHAPEAAKNIKGRFLILHGAEDTVAPLDEVNKLIRDFRAAKTDWQVELYSGAEHGFTIPKNPAEERANALSTASMTGFFRDIFRD